MFSLAKPAQEEEVEKPPLNWYNLVVYGSGEEVEEFLWDADIGSVIFSLDVMRLKNTLLGCIPKFEKYPGIQSRAFQMLQDCHLLSPPGIQNDELIPRYDAILRSLSSWSTKEDVILHAFEFLSMVADRDIMKKRSVSTDDGQLIYFINKAIAYHHSSIPLQRASLQLFEAIIENIQEKKHLKYIATTIFKSVLDNLLLKNNDVAICHSSFSIMLSLADHASELIRPWTDQLINLSIGSVMKHHSPEVTSKCILLMDKLTQDSEALLTIVRHSCGLMFFPDALQYLRASHIFAATVCLELFLHILEDFDVATIAFQNTRGLHPIDYAIRLRAILKDRFEKYLGLTVDLDQKDEELLQFLFLLHTHIDELIDEMLQPPEPGYTRSEAPRRPAMIESLAVEDNNQFEHAPDQLNSDFAASVQVVSSDSTLDGVEVVVVEAENDLDQQLKLVHSAEQSKDSSENTETIPDEEQDMIENTEQDDIEELSLPKEISTIEVRQQQDINVEVVESQEVIQQEVKIAEEIIQEEESIRDTVSEEVIAVPDDLEASAEVHFEVKEVEKETEHHGEDVPAAEPNAVVATEQEVQTVIKSNDVITSKEKEIREDLKLDLPKVSTEITPPPGMMASPAPMDQRTEATINGSLSIGSGSVGSASFDAPFSHRAGQRVIRLATFNPHASSSLPLRPSVATNSGHLSARSNTSDTPPYIGIAVEKSTDNPIVPSGKKLVDVKYLDELKYALKTAQSQASNSSKQVEIMQNQFLEAMQKMELLVLENTKLWNQLQQGNNTASEQKADHGNQQSKRKKKRVKSTCSVAIESCQYSMALAGIFEGLDHKEGKDLLVNSKPATDAKGANTEVEEVVHNQYLSGVLDHMSDVESLISNIQQFYTILVKSYNSSRNKTSEKASLSGIISVTRLKEALLKINLIDHVFLTETYINTLFASINSNHVSIYGAAYILMVCAKKRFSKKAGIHLVRAVSSLLSMYLIEWTHITSKIKKEDTNQIKQSDLEAEPYMTKFEFDEVVAVLEQEKSNLWQVFDAHVTNKTYDASNRLRKLSNNMKMMVAMKRQMSMNLDPTQKVIRRISEQCPEKFTDELNNQQYELNFHDIIQFTKEYHISPNMLSRLQLHEILLSLSNRQGNNSSTNHLLSKTVNVKSNPSEASTIAKKEAEEEIPQKNDVLEDDSDTASEDSRDVILGQMAMEVEDGEDSASDDDEHHNADSLDISLSGLHAGVLEVHVNFVQFLDFIVLMALRCPLFRDAPSLAAKVRNFLHTMISSQGSGMNRQSVPMNTYNPTLDLMSMQTDVFIEMQQGHDVFDNAVMNYNPYSMDESMHRGGAGYFSVMGATYPYLPNMTMPTNIPPPAYPNSSLPVAVAEAFPDEIDEVDRKIQQNHQTTNSATTTSSGIANLFSFFTSAPKPANPPPDGSK